MNRNIISRYGYLLKHPIKTLLRKFYRMYLVEDLKRKYSAQRRGAVKYLEANKVPELSEEAIHEIDNYWVQFGIKFQDYSWFRWYYGITGIQNPQFIPPTIHAYMVCPYYNNENFLMAWNDKNYFEMFLPDVNFPLTYIKKKNGRFFDGSGKYLKDEETVACSLLNAAKGKTVIVKDAWDSGEGRGVSDYRIEATADVEHILCERKKSNNFLIQEMVVQHQCFSQFNASSVNIVRINSWRHGDEVEILNATVRIGIEGELTDICYIDGVARVNLVKVEANGKFGKEIIDQYGRKRDNVCPIKEVPRWKEIIKIVKDNHKKIDHFDFIGWDFTVDVNNNIVCIEYNTERPGSVYYQYVHGPFYGQCTDEILSFLKESTNQEIYVPDWISVSHKRKKRGITDVSRIIRSR